MRREKRSKKCNGHHRGGTVKTYEREERRKGEKARKGKRNRDTERGEMENERRTSSYRWPRRDEVCTWCRLTCLFSWRTRPRCRKVPGQPEQRASRETAPPPLPLPRVSSSPFPILGADPLPPPVRPPPPSRTFPLIRLCLLALARVGATRY